MHSQTSPSPTTPPGRRLRILIADDEPMILNALRLLLERRGHEVHAAADAYEALAKLEKGHFDAVMVDAHMPGNGHSVLEHLAASDFEGIRILMTGALAADAKGDQDGVCLLQKPFSFPSVIPLLENGKVH